MTESTSRIVSKIWAGGRIFIRDITTGATRELGAGTNVGKLGWSPDGRFLLTANGTGVHRIDAQTGETFPIALGTGKSEAAWSPDGAGIYYRQAFAAPDGGDVAFIARDLASGTERVITRQGNIDELFLSPDGRYIATNAHDASSITWSVLVIPTAGGEPRKLMDISLDKKAPREIGAVMWAPDSRSVLAMGGAGGQEDVWQVPLDGKPRKLFTDTEGRFVSHPVAHPDGKRIAAARLSGSANAGRLAAGIWVLENFLPRPASSTR